MRAAQGGGTIAVAFDRKGPPMVIAADYPFIDILGTMLVFFGVVVWFWLLIRVFADVFRRDDIGGWAKFFWSVFVIVAPLVGALVYLIAEGKEMGNATFSRPRLRRRSSTPTSARRPATAGPAARSRTRSSCWSGAISQTEFEQIKQRALA